MKELGERKYEGIQTISTGHWIFAGIFVVAFIAILVWAYTKDRPVSRKYYARSLYFLLGIMLVLFLLFIFRTYIR